MNKRVVFDGPLIVSRRDEAVVQTPRFRIETKVARQHGAYGCRGCGNLIPYPDVTLCTHCFPPPSPPLSPEEALRRIVEQLSTLLRRV